MGLDMKMFFKQCHLRIMPLLIIYATAAYFVKNYFTMDGWLPLIFSIAVYAIGYLVISWFVLAKQDEKELVTGFFKKIKRK